MTTIAQMALKNIQEDKQRQARVKSTENITIAGARQRVKSSLLGEITRRKTDDPLIVDLYSGENKVGWANAIYKTPTQRVWTVSIKGQTIFDQHTINKGIRALLEITNSTQTTNKVVKVKASAKSKRSAKAVLEAQ